MPPTHCRGSDGGGARPLGRRARDAAVRALRQRPGVHRQRAAGLVPHLAGRERLHRARLAVAERLRRVLRLTRTRRAARRRDLLLPCRGKGHGRGLAPGLQPPPPTLSARDDFTRHVRPRLEDPPRRSARRLAAFALRAHSTRRRHPYPSTRQQPPTLTSSEPMNGVRSNRLNTSSTSLGKTQPTATRYALVR